MIVLETSAAIVAVCAVLALGNIGAIANALMELVRIAQREHGIREQERARRDENKAATIERRGIHR